MKSFKHSFESVQYSYAFLFIQIDSYGSKGIKMKKHTWPLIVLLSLSLVSCGGGDDDDNNNDTPQREETTGTNGTTGTTGTTGGTTTSCLTNSQKEKIRDYLNRASDLRTFTGSGTETIKESDGTDTVNAITGTFDYQQANVNTWIANGSICRAAPSTLCFQRQIVYSFSSGCLNVNGVRAKILSTSDSSLSFSYFDTRTVTDRVSIATGKFTFKETERKNGTTTYILDFKED
jgi:hypothetical protein